MGSRHLAGRARRPVDSLAHRELKLPPLSQGRALHAEPETGPSTRSHKSAFRRLLVGSAISNLGDGVTFVALPLLLVARGMSATEVGVFMGTLTVPRLFAPLAGAIVDRLSRRRLMVFGDVVRAAGVCVIALFAGDEQLGGLVAIYGAAFCMGCGDVLHDSASAAFLPALVPREQLESANGALIGTQTVAAALAGPPLGALLFTVGQEVPLYVDAATFLVSALVTLTLPEPPATERPDGDVGLVQSVGQAFRWLSGQPLLTTLLVVSAGIGLVRAGLTAVLIFFVVQTLGASEMSYGVLLGLFGVGGVVGGVSVDPVIRRVGVRVVLLLNPLLLGTAMALMALFPSTVLTGVLLFAYGFALVTCQAAVGSIQQRLTPSHLLGRVISVSILVGAAAAAAGAMLAGVLVETNGIQDTFLGGAGVALAAGLYLLVRSRSLDFSDTGARASM